MAMQMKRAKAKWMGAFIFLHFLLECSRCQLQDAVDPLFTFLCVNDIFLLFFVNFYLLIVRFRSGYSTTLVFGIYLSETQTKHCIIIDTTTKFLWNGSELHLLFSQMQYLFVLACDFELNEFFSPFLPKPFFCCLFVSKCGELFPRR
jgi:hypothetical protein